MILPSDRPRSLHTLLRLGALERVLSPWAKYVGVAVAVTVAEELVGVRMITLTTAPFTMVGLAVSIFLGFRNNACYDRWWEARRLWGGIVNTTRSLARQILTVVQAPAAEAAAVAAWRQRVVRMTIAWTYAVKRHLRQDGSDLAGWLDADALARVRDLRNVPTGLLRELGRELAAARAAGWLDPLHVPALDATLTELSNLHGACERIQSTPVPYAYTMLTHRIIGVYCLALPLGLVDTAGWMTPVVVALVSFAFLSLDAVGTEVEEPFGTDPNDLPLAAICRNIEIDLLQAIGDPELPAPAVAVDDILS